MSLTVLHFFSAPPLRSLRLCGAIQLDHPKNRRDAENAEEAQRVQTWTPTKKEGRSFVASALIEIEG